MIVFAIKTDEVNTFTILLPSGGWPRAPESMKRLSIDRCVSLYDMISAHAAITGAGISFRMMLESNSEMNVFASSLQRPPGIDLSATA